MGEHNEPFVGFDVAKSKHAVAIADGRRGGKVRFLGEISSAPQRWSGWSASLAGAMARCIAWKGQVLCARYRRLSQAGKKLPVVGRGDLPARWPPSYAIGREVAPA